MQERRHKVTLLVEIWTFIAGLYTRGGLFDDAKGAIDEAADLVRTLENDVAAISSSAKAFTEKGWGGGKPVEELWGDVWAQVSASETAFEDIPNRLPSAVTSPKPHQPLSKQSPSTRKPSPTAPTMQLQ